MKTCRGNQWLHVYPFESQLNAFGGQQLAAHMIFFGCVHHPVIVMTFWYIFGTDLTFFELFKLYFHLGLITTPSCFL